MAYGKMDNPGSDMPMEHDEGMHDEPMHEGMEHDDKEYPSLFLSKEMLPEGMKANPGDILEFKVVGMDKDGDTEVVYNTDKENGKGDDDMSEWENDFRKEMSPRQPEESA